MDSAMHHHVYYYFSGTCIELVSRVPNIGEQLDAHYGAYLQIQQTSSTPPDVKIMLAPVEDEKVKVSIEEKIAFPNSDKAQSHQSHFYLALEDVKQGVIELIDDLMILKQSEKGAFVLDACVLEKDGQASLLLQHEGERNSTAWDLVIGHGFDMISLSRAFIQSKEGQLLVSPWPGVMQLDTHPLDSLPSIKAILQEKGFHYIEDNEALIIENAAQTAKQKTDEPYDSLPIKSLYFSYNAGPEGYLKLKDCQENLKAFVQTQYGNAFSQQSRSSLQDKLATLAEYPAFQVGGKSGAAHIAWLAEKY